MRLMTYNIHKGFGGRDRRYCLQRIVAVLTHEAPDLVCLQEVDWNVRRTGHDDQPALLAAALRLDYPLYQLNHRRAEGGYGNLILSRWPLLDRHQITLKMGWRKARGAQMAVVATPSGPLHLVNWHLGLAERERHWQVGVLLGHHLLRDRAHLPTLIAGDTNDWRQTLGRGPFTRHGYRQVTAPPAQFRSFPALIPVGSLDKVYARGPVEVVEARVVATRA